MLKRKIALPTVTNPNPAAGQTSVITVPGGLRCHQILLKITGSTATSLPITTATGSYIKDVRVKLGGKVQRLHTAWELNNLNKVNGSTYGAYTVGSSGTNYGQIIPIFFAEPWRNENAQGEYLAWPSTKDQLIEVEVDVFALPTGTTPVLTISAHAIVDNGLQPNADKNGVVISKVFRNDFAAATSLDITTLDKRDLYQGIYIQANAGSTTLVSKAIVKANGTLIHELPYSENFEFLSAMGLTETFDYSLVVDADDPIQNGLPASGLSDLQLRIENTASPTTVFRVLAQRLGSPE